MPARTDKAKQKVTDIIGKMRVPLGGFDHPDPAQEAAEIADKTSSFSFVLSGWSERMQRRMAFGVRYLKALQDVTEYAQLAFAQVAEEAIVDAATGEAAVTETTIKGLQPEREQV